MLTDNSNDVYISQAYLGILTNISYESDSLWRMALVCHIINHQTH